MQYLVPADRALQPVMTWQNMAILNAKGITPRGVKSVETAVSGSLFVEELRKRNIQFTEKLTYL